MKKTGIIIVSLLMICLFALQGVEACDRQSKGCDMAIQKARIVLQNREELALTDEQITQIRILKADAQKDSIRKEAEIDVLKVDISSQMREEEIDSEAINALIDKKYDLKKLKAKASVKAYVALREVLTEEQKEKMHSLWCAKGKHGWSKAKGSLVGSHHAHKAS